MIKYNWESIKRYTKGDMAKICSYFKNVHIDNKNLLEYLSKNKYAKSIVRSSSNTLGMSFIINIDSFIKNEANATDSEMLVYLDLISKRDMFSYFNSKNRVVHLPIWKVTEYSVEQLKLNKLLYIDEKFINFVYELGE